MIIARVLGSVVSTEKNRHYAGRKILVVQPVTPDGKPKGASFLAVDGVQAGVGDTVLVVDEGGSARLAVDDEAAVTIRTAICGIVDSVDVAGGRFAGGDAAGGAAVSGPAAGGAPAGSGNIPAPADTKKRRRP